MIISGKARLAAVIGWPVSHSLSPRLHGYWLEHYAVDGVLVPLAVKPQDFSAMVRALGKMGFAGACVTLPHKQAALQIVDKTDAGAVRIGAVNMITFQEDGKLFGQNTDGFGFIENLKQHAPHWQAQQGAAVLLGAGGAARAVLQALCDAGVPEIRLVNRTHARAQELAAAFAPHVNAALRVCAWSARESALSQAALLVNATSLGMAGQAPLDLKLDALNSQAVVNDIVYTPRLTPLLQDARARGLVTVDGLGMLINQARPAFQAWFGHDPEVTDGLRAFLNSAEPGAAL